MNPILELNSQLSQALAKLVDGTLDDQRFDELQQQLANDGNILEAYLAYVDLHVCLPRSLSGIGAVTGDAAESIGPADWPSIGKRSLVLRFLAGVRRHVPGGEFTVGGLIVLVLVAAFWGLQQGRLNPRWTVNEVAEGLDADRTDSLPSVATIRATSDIAWSREAKAKLREASVKPGELLKIDSGIVELQLNRGATLLVEGPAQWSIDGENQATLKQGKLVAKIPQQAIGFTLDMPTARIVDLGTEFGAEVTESGDAAVRVFEGYVDVSLEKEHPTREQTVRLSAGQSRRVTRINDKLRLVENAANANGFVREIDPLISSTPKHASDVRRRILNDSALLVHFNFDNRGEDTTQLDNRATATRGKYNGKIHGATWTQGSKPGRSALAFSKPGDRVELNVDGQFAALSIAASIYFEPLSSAPDYRPILMGDLWGMPGQFHWQLRRDDKQNISLCGPNDSVHGADCPTSWAKGDFGRWLKLAVIMDTKTREAVFFLDGSIIGTSMMPPCDHLVLGAMNLGHWIPWKKEVARNLVGRIDEFAVFGRALWPAELRALMAEATQQDE